MQTTVSIQPEAVPVLKSSLAMKRHALEYSARQYRSRIEDMIRKHQMDSQRFITLFGSGELGDDSDWIEWQFLLDALQEAERQLSLLDSIQL